MKRKGLLVLVLSIIALVFLAGCLPIPGANQAPQITNSTPSTPYTATPNQVVTFNVTATDPDGDSLTYSWTCSAGTLSATTGTQVNWTAPASGTASVAVAVADGQGHSVNRSWAITIEGTQNKTIVNVTDNITQPTVWTADNLYVIEDSTIWVESALTIQPGVIVKFKPGKSMVVNTAGTLKAQGSATAPIIFTSYADDAHGGDTNGDGDVSVPGPTDWNGIEVRNQNGTIFDYCQFYYGGYDNTLLIGSVNAKVTNSIFAHNGTNEAYAALNFVSALSGTIISNNTFYDNHKPIIASTVISIDDSNIFHNPTDSSQRNKLNGIFIAEGNMHSAISWSETEVPYVINDNIWVNTDASLTINDNVIVKFKPTYYIRVVNVLNAVATNRIIFTAYNDDTHGGDTNGDGPVTTPLPGQWVNIGLQADSTGNFDKCEFYYGGTNNAYTLGTSGVNVRLSVKNCIFAYNSAKVNQGALQASEINSYSVIANNTFYGNQIPLVVNCTISLDDSNKFSNPTNPSEKNAQNGIWVLSDNHLTSAITWAETEVPFVIADYFWIDENEALSIGDNVVLKFSQGKYVVVEGALNPGSGVWFTSLKDDTHGGDTNADGNITTPQTGDWDGIKQYGTNWWYDWSSILYAQYHGVTH